VTGKPVFHLNEGTLTIAAAGSSTSAPGQKLELIAFDGQQLSFTVPDDSDHLVVASSPKARKYDGKYHRIEAPVVHLWNECKTGIPLAHFLDEFERSVLRE
jgi:hypothetical protein